MSDAIPPVVPTGRLAALPQPEFYLPGTGGLHLRPWTAYDAPALVEACHDPDIRFWNRPSLLDEAGAVARIARWETRRQAEEGVLWAVAPAQGGQAFGLVGLGDVDLAGGSAEFLYWLLPAGRGVGVMARATDLVSRWAFETLGLHRLRITHSVRNPASCVVALRAGFPLEGTMRGALLHADGWHDEHLHARLRTD
ncbi:GNAT family N-acetyltransferase [Streptomyces sp. NPDC058613]|uniref:GNAT family N-acetyltransferase n=1 Tax=unclassified Streptomyces TaxID=2593676 RepID=UPI0036669B7F